MPDASGIVVRGQLRALDIHRCERPPARRGCVVIDLQRMSWCEPAGLVALAALAERATAQDYGVILRAPRNANVANYLGRMRLGRVMRELGAEHDLPVVRERPLETSLVELVPLSDEGDCDGAAASVRDATEAKCGSPVADRLYETLIEAVQNVVQHSRASIGFTTAQAFPTKKLVKFAVADGGIGLQRSLRERGADDDDVAIELALDGTSRLSEDGRGYGFPTMRQVTGAAGGRLEIISGRARFNGRRIVSSRDGTFRGTLIQGTLRYAS